MKKTLLLTLALFLSTIVFAQKRATFVSESFDGPALPEGWTAFGDGTGNWSISSTTLSGGEGKELKLSWSPEFNGTARLATTAFDLTGINDVTISFKHLFDNFKDGQFFHTIGIATSSDNGVTWNTGWSQEYTTTNVYEVNEVMTTSDMGKENVMFCLFYEGDSHNMDNWFFDDLLIYKQTELDIRLVGLNIPNIVEAGDVELSFTVENLGVKTIESFDVEINISDSESVINATVKKEIAHSEIAQITLEGESFKALARNKPYHISLNITSVNETTDEDPRNNKLEKDVKVAFNKAQRIPMIEHFSSSTCGPCVAVNQQMHTLTNNNEGRYTYTKFPTAGDPYHTTESAYKVKEYGVTGVPNIFLDGSNKGSNYLTQIMLDERCSTPAFADIRGAFNVEGNMIHITADFLSYVKLENAKAYISINEKTTKKNTGSNGETEFHHILMKMLDSKSGNALSLNSGNYKRYEFSFDMSETHVEEMNDLEVALWLQDSITKEIYNSNFAYAYAEHCYPVQNLTLTENGDEKTLTWETPEQGSPKGYNIYVDGVLTAENVKELSYTFTSGERFTAEVIALYEEGRTSVGVAKLFGYEEEIEVIETPENLTATATSTSAIELKWNKTENATSYNIYRDDEFLTNVAETNHTDEGLNYNTEYCYTVTAVVNDLESEHSEKVCVKTLGENIEEMTTSYNIYPNPANDVIYIETEFEIEEISIYDIYGRRQIAVTPSRQVDVADLNSGIYFIKINTEKGNIVKRFIKQ